MGRLDIYISNKGTSEQALDNSAANGGIAPESKSNNSATNGMARTIAASAITHSLVNAGISNAKSIIQNHALFYEWKYIINFYYIIIPLFSKNQKNSKYF